MPPAAGLQSWMLFSHPGLFGMGTLADDDPVMGAFFTSRSYILLAVEILQRSRNPTCSLKSLLSVPCALNKEGLLDFSLLWGATVWAAFGTS